MEDEQSGPKKELSGGSPAGGDAPERLQQAIRDILASDPQEISIKFRDKVPLGPGGIRGADGSWDGNLYKYRY